MVRRMITKGKILREDLALYDGINTRETRRDSTGGTIQGNRVGGQVDVMVVYGPDRHRSSIVRAMTAIGNHNVTLNFTPGIWEIDIDLTIPDNFTCYIHAGAVFSVASGKTLTIDGPIIREADIWYTGSISYNGISLLYYPFVYAETSGVVYSPEFPPGNLFRYIPRTLHADILSGSPDGTVSTTNVSSYLQAALDLNFGELLVPQGAYKLASGIIHNSRTIVRGMGFNTLFDFDALTSGIAWAVNYTGTSPGSPDRNHEGLRDIYLRGPGKSVPVTGLHTNPTGTTSNVATLKLNSVVISHFETGLYTTYTQSSSWDELTIASCALGAFFGAQTNQITLGLPNFVNNDQHFQMNRCTSIKMNGVKLQNITDTGTEYLFTMEESDLVMVSPYIENASNADVCQLGASGDADACALIIDGGNLPGDKEIHLSAVNAHVRVSGSDIRNDENIVAIVSKFEDVGATGTINRGCFPTVYSLYEPINNAGNIDAGEVVFAYDYVNAKTYGGADTIVDNTGYATISDSSAMTESATIVPGQYYTLITCAQRENSAAITHRQRTGGGAGTIVVQFSAVNCFPDRDSGDFRPRYWTFKAVGDTFQLLHTTTELDMKFIRLVKGIFFDKIDRHISA